MTGLASFCAYREVVEVAAPAINERTSRRLTHLRDAITLKLECFILSPIGGPSVADPSISRDADLVPNGLRQAGAVRHRLWCIEGDSEYRNSFVKSLDMAVPKSFQSALAPDALGDLVVYQDFPICRRCA
jgi:hypothetical protein